MNVPELSLVVPAYNESLNLEAVILEATQIFSSAGISYEINIVNNGSTDATQEVIEELQKNDPHIFCIRLQRNLHYGGGILAGLRDARGATLGWMHADGQADPRDVVRLYRDMRAFGLELGKAIRVARDESPWRKIQGHIWYT